MTLGPTSKPSPATVWPMDSSGGLVMEADAPLVDESRPRVSFQHLMDSPQKPSAIITKRQATFSAELPGRRTSRPSDDGTGPNLRRLMSKNVVKKRVGLDEVLNDPHFQQLSPTHIGSTSQKEIANVYEVLLPQTPRRAIQQLLSDSSTRRPSETGSVNLNRPLLPLINPRSRNIRRWDGALTILLLYIAVFTPYEIAFMEHGVVRFVVNRVIDVAFVADMVAQFFLPFMDGQGRWVMNHGNIARNYLCTFFVIDLVSVVPYDIIALSLEDSSDGDLDNLGVLRLLRLFRMAKLLRVLRAGRMLRRWESTAAINYSLVLFLKFTMASLLACHWLACGWYLIVDLEGGDGPCAPGEHCPKNWSRNYELLDSSAGGPSVYLVCIYWSVATLSTLGYGDVIPTTDGERAYTVVAMLLGAVFYGYAIGTACSFLVVQDEKRRLFYQTMDILARYMDDKRLPPVLRVKLREFFRFRRHNIQLSETSDLLRQMSPLLRSEVQSYVHSAWMAQLPAFAETGAEFVDSLTMSLASEAFSNSEPVIRPGMPALTMYIVDKGVVHCGDSCTVVTHGEAFGMDMLFRAPPHTFVRQYSCVTLTNTVVLTLQRDLYFRVLEDHPQHKRRLRKFICTKMFHDSIMQYKDAMKRLEVIEADGWKRDLEEEFSPNMLPLAFMYRHDRLRPEERTQFMWAALIMQRVAKAFLRRRAARKMLTEKRQSERSRARMMAILNKIGLPEHLAKLEAEKIEYDHLQDLTAGDLKAAGVPLGEGVMLLRAHQEMLKAADEGRDRNIAGGTL